MDNGTIKTFVIPMEESDGEVAKCNPELLKEVASVFSEVTGVDKVESECEDT